MLHFTPDGLLPIGDHVMTIDDLRTSLLVVGPQDGSPWSVRWRRYLVDQLELMASQLWRVGITEIFIDGSFVEDKARPSDIDGYFVCDMNRFVKGELQRELNLLDPSKIWTWENRSRAYDRDSAKLQLPMWHKYRVELYPEFGQGSGILDEYGHTQKFPAAFRKTRDTFQPKGIVKIIR